MFIEGVTRLDEALLQQHLKEEESIQLINFYGKQLVDKLELGNHQTTGINTEDQNELALKIDDLQSGKTANDWKRNYEREKLAFMETVQRTQMKPRRLPSQIQAELVETQRKQSNKPAATVSVVPARPMKRMSPPRERKMQAPYETKAELQNRRLNQKFGTVREVLLRENIIRTAVPQEEREQRVDSFIQRMQEDRRRRISNQIQKGKEMAIHQQRQASRSQHYRSVTPTIDDSKEEQAHRPTTKELARSSLLRRKKRLQEEYQKLSFRPSLSPGIKPQGRHIRVKPDFSTRYQTVVGNPVVKLGSPHELDFLVGDPQ